MNVTQIVERFRESYLDDAEEPYLWSNREIIASLIWAINDLCRDTFILVDTSSALTSLKLLSNVSYYPLDERILYVTTARLSVTGGWPLRKISEDKLNWLIPNWRDITGTPSRYIMEAYSNGLAIYPKFDEIGEVIGSGDISFVAGTKKITQATGTFTSHFAVGDEINVDGTDDNDGYLTIANVTDTEITVNETLVDENDTSAQIRKVRDTLLMTISRLPLTDITEADIGASPAVSPEIKTHYHELLFEGMAKKAFLKPDSDCFDKKRSQDYGLEWERSKSKAKRDLIFLTDQQETAYPRAGNL